MENNELYHHGVKGMKWGVRRSPAQLGHPTSKGKKTGRFSFGKKKKPVEKRVDSEPKKKSVKDMSDTELREVISRMRLEQDYANLSSSQVSKGKKFVDRMLNNVITPAAEDVAKQLVKSAMTKGVNSILGLDEEFKVYTNNKKK